MDQQDVKKDGGVSINYKGVMHTCFYEGIENINMASARLMIVPGA